MLAAASVVFWALQVSAPADSMAPPAVVNVMPPVDPAAIARLLGAASASATTATQPSAAARFALLGVVADETRQGAALIAVDGQAARPFRVGAVVAPGYVLQSVTPQAAALGSRIDSNTAFTLQLPTRALAGRPPVRSGPG